jgi:hypothetical protein
MPVAVADLKDVQGRPGVRQFAAHDHAHIRAGLGPTRQVQQVRDFDDGGVFLHAAVAVVRGLPGVCEGLADGVADRFGDRVADRELQALRRKGSD